MSGDDLGFAVIFALLLLALPTCGGRDDDGMRCGGSVMFRLATEPKP